MSELFTYLNSLVESASAECSIISECVVNMKEIKSLIEEMTKTNTIIG